MAPTKRNKNNSDLTGTNIKVRKKGGKYYYYYKMPKSWQEHPSFDGRMDVPLEHGNRQTSIEAALSLNRELRESGSIVERIVNAPARPTTKNPPIVQVIDEFQFEWLQKQNYAESSLDARLTKLNQYRTEWPHDLVGALDTFHIAQFLRKFGPSSAHQHRILLVQLFSFAASNGYTTLRPMVEIQKVKRGKPKRARHTWDGHMAIYNASPAWLKRAIFSALLTLQRRSDLVGIHIKDHINLETRTIQILQDKTRNYDKPVFIEIGVGDELFQNVLEAVKSDIPCPYLIHHRPKRITRQMRETRLHPFAVPADYLTRAYSEVRDSIGIYDHLPKLERPGIHSLRALGIWAYKKAGYPDEYIMALSGHADKRMMDHYESGHEKKKPIKVNAELSISSVDFSNINWETDLPKSLLKIINSDEGN